MNTFYKLVGIFVLSASSCLASDCISTELWETIIEKCRIEMADTDDCFRNCVHENQGLLDDSGYLAEDAIRNSQEKRIKDPELLEVFKKRVAACLSKTDCAMDKCEASNMFYECFWDDQEVKDTIKEKFCGEDAENKIRGL